MLSFCFCGNAGFRPLFTKVNDLLSRQPPFLTGCYFQMIWKNEFPNVPMVRIELTCKPITLSTPYESEEIHRCILCLRPELHGFKWIFSPSHRLPLSHRLCWACWTRTRVKQFCRLLPIHLGHLVILGVIQESNLN